MWSLCRTKATVQNTMHNCARKKLACAVLQVLGIPYTEELASSPRNWTPPDPVTSPPNKRPKLSHESGTHRSTDVSDAPDSDAPDSAMQDQDQEREQVRAGVEAEQARDGMEAEQAKAGTGAEQAKAGVEAEQARVCRVIQVHGVRLLRQLNGGSEPGQFTNGTTATSSTALTATGDSNFIKER